MAKKHSSSIGSLTKNNLMERGSIASAICTQQVRPLVIVLAETIDSTYTASHVGDSFVGVLTVRIA